MKTKILFNINLYLFLTLFVLKGVSFAVSPESAYELGLATRKESVFGYYIYEVDIIGTTIYSMIYGIIGYLVLFSWNLGLYTYKRFNQERVEYEDYEQEITKRSTNLLAAKSHGKQITDNVTLRICDFCGKKQLSVDSQTSCNFCGRES